MILIPFATAILLICSIAVIYINTDAEWILPVGVLFTYIVTISLIVWCVKI